MMNAEEGSEMYHWHVCVANFSDMDFVTESMWDALLNAEEELQTLTDIMYQDISGLGESGMYEESYAAFKKWQTLDNLYSNVKNINYQHSETDESKRAPLFQGENASYKLNESAVWLIDTINNSSDVEIRGCTEDECLHSESEN